MSIEVCDKRECNWCSKILSRHYVPVEGLAAGVIICVLNCD
jgi:hypothetical protein